MSSKSCCLRQHIRDEDPTFLSIKLSLDDTVLSHGLHGLNLPVRQTEENFELFDIDDTRPESGSLAILR